MEQFLADVITLITDENGVILYIHDDYAKILGVTPDEAEGKYCCDIIPGSRMHIVAKTGKKEIGVPFRMKNGEYSVINRLPVSENGNIKAVICIVLFSTDILTTEKSIYMADNLRDELLQYKTDLTKLRGAKYSIDNIIGNAPPIRSAKEAIYSISQTKSTILIGGETGTGKELFAHAIHHLSPRSHQPMVTVNCGAIPTELFESELFGYEEGSFTNARKGGKAGKFEQANKGTLVLDEIHLLPLQMQPKLLRVLQEKEIERIGSNKSKSIDVRLIFITNRNLQELVDKGGFREDLFYRINIVPLEIPPLRERMADIPELTEHLIKKINHNLGLKITGIDPEVLQLFTSHNWPGNVRELEHLLERAANMCLSGRLKLECFQSLMTRLRAAARWDPLENTLTSVKKHAEHEKIVEALTLTRGNISDACRLLNMSRSNMYEKIKKYNIDLNKT
jgi:transcriptional regulator with PAS, ATPase and Fis domain